ncbi:MAG: hypothetical protein QME94_05005 [Anaerolineae bacterium]|nr:hypothetical protein [Anaerolineae bacterium]
MAVSSPDRKEPVLLDGEPPFVWPEPRVLEGKNSYAFSPPFSPLVCASDALFGITTGLSGDGVEAVGGWLHASERFRAKLIVAVYPTCNTREEDLFRILEMTRRFGGRLEARVYPCKLVTDRPANVLCLKARSDEVHFVVGTSENFGFEPSAEGKANLVFRADVALVESFRRHFDWLWGRSTPLSPATTQIPLLMLPQGDSEGARLWEDFLSLCAASSRSGAKAEETVRVDPETGDVTILAPNGEELVSPTEEIGVAKLDLLAREVSQLYERGCLVSVDKRSRIGPLDAPLSPNVFGDSAEMQAGRVTRKVSLRVSIVDERTLRDIEKWRKAFRNVLNKFTFGLADNTRWMPHAARPLFETEVQRIDGCGRRLLDRLLGGATDDFVAARSGALLNDIYAMYQQLGGRGEPPRHILDNAIGELRRRLERARAGTFVPSVSYSVIAFSTTTDRWASPWGQVYALLHDVASYPRKALTDPYFFRGLRVNARRLIEAMDVAGDAVVRHSMEREVGERCKAELEVLTKIDTSQLETRDRCDLVWKLIRGEKAEDIEEDLKRKEEAR